MISEIILGTFIPVVLIYNGLPFVQNVCQSIHTNFKVLSNIYFNILRDVQAENEDNLFLQILSPTIATVKLFNYCLHSIHSYYTYFNNKNIHLLDHHYIVHYTLHGNKYFIVLDKKQKSSNSILSVTGFTSLPFSILKEEQEDNKEEEQEVSEEEQKDNEEEQEDNEEEQEDNEEEQKDNEEEQEEQKNNEEEQKDNEEEKQEVNSEEEQEEDENNDELSDTEKIIEIEEDITEYFKAFYGPSKDFHGSKITPEIIGFDKIIIKYLNGDTIEEEEKIFINNEIITF